MEIPARPCVRIRQHVFGLSALAKLETRGRVTPPLATFLRAAVRARFSSAGAGGPPGGVNELGGSGGSLDPSHQASRRPP